MTNKFLAAEKFAYQVLLLFYPFRDEKELLGFPSLHQNKLGEQGVQAVVKFEPYHELVDQAVSPFNEKSITNQDSHSHVEIDETPGAEYHLEDKKQTKYLYFPTLCQKYYQMMKSQKV